VQMYIKRTLAKKIKELSKKMPVISLVGPRQSGKSTLAKHVFPNHEYISLEELDNRSFAQTDPREFLATHGNKNGLIIDEIQHVPSLLSYIQTIVDAKDRPGYYVLTGSQNFLIGQAIVQTLAGRIGILTLLPLSIKELQDAKLLPEHINTLLFKGCYPRVWVKDLSPIDWYPTYIRTYVERDVRLIKNITDLSLFIKFIKLCAGRIGQLLNVSSLANDCDISVATVNSWLSLLQESYIIFLLQPHFKNFGKRLIKSPKIFFYDTGLACSLLAIESEKQLSTHYLRGGLFESLIISDLFKQRFNKGLPSNYYFWRDKHGHEVDCVAQRADTLIPIEIKAGSTIHSNFFTGLNYWNTLTGNDPKDGFLVYTGHKNQTRSQAQVLSWQSVYDINS